jgi:hypothetical protein
VKRICRYLPILSLPLLCVPFASAQSSVDFMLGFGTAHDSANGGGIENANSINAYATCTPGSADIYCQTNPSLGGFFLGFGGDVMLWKRFGIGATATVQPSRSNYGTPTPALVALLGAAAADENQLVYRQAFYDVNGIFRPVSTKRLTAQLEGGIGGAHTGFGVNETQCAGTVACASGVEPFASSNHFDIHVGASVSLYVTEHLFIRPEFDLHYAPGLGGVNNEFNSNLVPMGMVWVGYTFGDR